MDSFLLEAMREVDAMLPGTPPIAPPEPPRSPMQVYADAIRDFHARFGIEAVDARIKREYEKGRNR